MSMRKDETLPDGEFRQQYARTREADRISDPDEAAGLWVEGHRPLGLQILDPRTGQRVSL